MSANFPTSLDSFPTHATGDVIQASYDNNEQDSIVAIETKIGINASADSTTFDYKLSGVTGSDKAVSKTGTETLTNKTLTAPSISNPTLLIISHATGDIYYDGGSGVLTRLPIGSSGQVVTVAGGVPTYATPTAISDGSYSTKGILQGLTDAATSGLTISSGVISVNSGTSANNILKLNGSSQIPAVSGFLLTNVIFSTSGVSAGPTASATQTITHNLGRPPTIIRIKGISRAVGGSVFGLPGISWGTWNGTGNRCVYIASVSGSGTGSGSSQDPSTSTSFAVRVDDGTFGGTNSTGVVGNVNSTTFDIVWTDSTATTLVNTQFLWETQ